jgi:hypothetical protein
MSLKISKAVKDGMLVRKRGDKYVRCGRGQVPHGVYQVGYSQMVDTGEDRKKVDVPTGVVLAGAAKVKLA